MAWFSSPCLQEDSWQRLEDLHRPPHSTLLRPLRPPLVHHQEEETLLPGRKGPAGARGARCLPLVSAHPMGRWLWRAEDRRGD